MGKKNILKGHAALFLLRLSSLIIISALLLFPGFSYADDETICAQVMIEIRQEMTLERQAFDAHMRINNGLSHITLQDVAVDVSFIDEEGNSVLASSDPDNTAALFFIRVDTMENIEDIDGSGTVAPSSSADIHWLIIPATGASNGLIMGTLYYVGATLTYTMGGEENVTEVSPDYIFVKPMPELTLDYFIPTDVYGDDAFTTEIEPPVPFPLGVRVKNNGLGVARHLKIDSAQPEIVENELGLLIGFFIEGSDVNGQPATESLLVDFGDIEPNTSGVARWSMICTLSGQFVDFTAEFSHSDELGGELTSLLEAVNTHFLVRDALVDLPGRDSICDFLARDGDVYRIYESDSADTVVLDQSASSTLQFEEQNGSQVYYTLSAPLTAGFMYVKRPDPYNGQKVIAEALRSDGKLIKADNVWLSKTRDGQSWDYFINLFDANTTGAYSIKFDDTFSGPQPPVLQFIPDRTRAEGQQLSFIVEASDPNGTIPMLSAEPLPAGADFTDQENGIGIFDWTPAEGQAGTYSITFKASDGILEDSQRAVITIYSGSSDSDNDGMPDDWEMQHFNTLDRDGSGDFDGDGISDLDEYLNGTDPASSNAPSIPVIVSPQDTSEMTGLQPDLVIVNSIDPDSDPVTYTFEVYADEGMTSLAAGQSDVSEGTETTSWTVSQELNDNTWYFWRVRAGDGIGFSAWAYGSFFVNTANDPPGVFNISSPEDYSEVDTITPVLAVTNSVDVDEDVLTYTFEVYADRSLNTPITSAAGIPEGTDGSTSWSVDLSLDDNTWYSWRVIATDGHGATAETLPASFFVNTANDAPQAPVISSPVDESEEEVQELDLVAGNAQDVDEDQLTYFFELDTVNTFDSPAMQSSGEITEGLNFTTWHVSGMEDNTTYFWRVKASDGFAQSPWAQGSFFVNTANDDPSTPTLKNPGQDAWVATLTPTLELNASQDPDNDDLIYRFEVYADEALSQPVAAGESESPEWVAPEELNDNTWYYWRAQAEDEHEATSGWMETASFFTDSNGINDPPTIVMQEPSEDLITAVDSILISWEDSDPETDAEIALYYDTDSFGEDGTLIVEGLMENPDEEDDSYLWDITAVAEGTYYIYGTISDGISSAASYAPGTVTIARPPEVEITSPQLGYALQDGVTFTAVATDDSGVAEVYFYLREENGANGIPIGYEDLPSSFNDTTGVWEYGFETTQVPDGYYVLLARAVDIYGNEGWSAVVSFSIRNWAVVELLPASENNQAGRTMPVKFALRISPEVDPTLPFVYNEELEIRIYDQANPNNILQSSFYGDHSKDYRINNETEHYITNFKTSKQTATYLVEIWRISNNFLVGWFSFETY